MAEVFFGGAAVGAALRPTDATRRGQDSAASAERLVARAAAQHGEHESSRTDEDGRRRSRHGDLEIVDRDHAGPIVPVTVTVMLASDDEFRRSCI